MNKSFQKNYKIINLIILCLLTVLTTSCYGPRLNKKYNDSNLPKPVLASHYDENIKVDLKELIVTNGENAWAKDAKWDEYIFNIDKLINKDIYIESIFIVDSLDGEAIALNSRRSLNKATKKTIKKYKKNGIKIKLGNGYSNVLVGSISGLVVSTGVGAGIASTGSVALSAGTLTTAGGAVFVAVPVLAVGGIIKIVNNSKINNKIQERNTELPLKIENSTLVDLFYPAVPSPKKIIINYKVNETSHSLTIDLADYFKLLHYKITED